MVCMYYQEPNQKKFHHLISFVQFSMHGGELGLGYELLATLVILLPTSKKWSGIYTEALYYYWGNMP